MNYHKLIDFKFDDRPYTTWLNDEAKVETLNLLMSRITGSPEPLEPSVTYSQDFNFNYMAFRMVFSNIMQAGEYTINKNHKYIIRDGSTEWVLGDGPENDIVRMCLHNAIYNYTHITYRYITDAPEYKDIKKLMGRKFNEMLEIITNNLHTVQLREY